jgi:hypothetical protein
MRDGWVEYKFKDVATAVKGKLPKVRMKMVLVFLTSQRVIYEVVSLIIGSKISMARLRQKMVIV